MSTQQLLVETVDRICLDHCNKEALDVAEQGEFPQALWGVLVSNGLHELALEDSGVALGETFAVLRTAARHALPIPLAEILLGKRWLADAGINTDAAVVSIGLLSDAADSAVHVPWGRVAQYVVAIEPGVQNTGKAVCFAAPGHSTSGQNIAGEPRDALAVPNSAQALDLPNAFAELALARTVQMAGALESVLDLSLQYVNEREQFGRPISKFQAIQHNLAVLASEVAAASRASDAAVAALGTERFMTDLAAAKARVGEAAGIAAEISHQVHGAMGFTYEHRLHHFTRRLWAWRDEYGNETHWQQFLGQTLVAVGADDLWSFIATPS